MSDLSTDAQMGEEKRKEKSSEAKEESDKDEEIEGVAR